MRRFCILYFVNFVNYTAVVHQLTLKTSPTFSKALWFLFVLIIFNHSLAGFNTCFSWGQISRFCLCHHSDICNKTEESECVLHTPDTHRRNLQVPDSKSFYGVNGPCPFDKLPHFEFTESFSILEGVVPLVLKLVLLKLTHERLITLQQFNDQFPFGQMITLTGLFCWRCHLRKSCWKPDSFFRLLPFLPGSFIPRKNSFWGLYLLLRSICDTGTCD